MRRLGDRSGRGHLLQGVNPLALLVKRVHQMHLEGLLNTLALVRKLNGWEKAHGGGCLDGETRDEKFLFSFELCCKFVRQVT